MSDPTQVPFHRSWRRADVDWSAYDQLEVAEVHTGHLLEQPWWREVHLADHGQQIDELATFMRETVVREFQADPAHRFDIVDEAQDRGLVLELALVELVPTRSALHAASYAAGPAGSLLRNSLLGTVAFEARVRDARSREVLATFADRERGQSAPVSTRNLRWYAHAHDIIETWAKQFVEVANKGPGDVVEDRWPFTLKPW